MRKLLQNRFLNNASWIVGGKIAQMCISLVISMITARYLGPSNYGLIGYVASYVSFFYTICTLGLNGIIVREFVTNKDRQGEYVGTAIGMRTVFSLVAIVFLQLLMAVIEPDDSVIRTITILSSISLVFHSFDIINYWFQSKMMSKVSAIVSIIAYIIMALYKIVILILGKTVEWFAFATTLDIILVAVLLFVAYYRYGGTKLSFSFKTAKYLLSHSYHFILSGVMVTVYAQTDKIMIGKMLTTTEVGIYTAAITICGLWSFIPHAIIDSARPIIMEKKASDEKTYLKRLKQLYASLIWLSVCYGLFITIFAKFIVSFLYGNDYILATTPLRIAVWYCAFSYLGSGKNIWLICEGKQKYEKWFTLGGATLNVALNFTLIPIMGINGAALATFLTQMATNFIFPFIPKETRQTSKLMLEAFLLRDVVSKETIVSMKKTVKNQYFKLRNR